MDSKLLKICLAACLAVSFAGCDDVDEDAPKAGDSCTATFHNVLGSEYGMACVNDKIIVTQCGDGKVEGAEQCEGSDVGEATCDKKLGAGAVGKVMCKGCLLDYSACSLPVTPTYDRVAGTCGDGTLNIGEDCDGANLDFQTCASLIVDGKGTLACKGCKFDYSGCYVGDKAPEVNPQPENACGNGTLDDDELCDIDAEGKAIIRGNVTCADALQDENATGEIGCSSACQLDVSQCEKGQVIPENCGNGQLDEGEECDLDADGNPMHLFGASCATALENEEATGVLGCTAECKVDTSACEAPEVLCGNGQLDEGEFCDGDLFVEEAVLTVECAEGYAQTAHPCNADCSAVDAEAACELIPENCGNETLDDGEACDGDLLNDMTCGDIEEGAEGELACNPVCKFDLTNCVIPAQPECGNGQLEDGEGCDDGNTQDGDGCSAECKIEAKIYCPEDADCDEGVKCDRGVCVSDEMLALEAGAACDPDTFVEFCNNDSIVYCGRAYDENGDPIYDDEKNPVFAIDIVDCGEHGGCGIVDMKEYMESDAPAFYAWCNTTVAEGCSEVGDKITYCNVDQYGAYASYIICEKNTADGFTGLDAANILSAYANCRGTIDEETGEESEGACNEEATQCEIPAVLWCDYATKCGEDGDTINTCSDYGIFGVYADTYSCAEIIPGSVCTTMAGEDYCFVPCETEGESLESCESKVIEYEDYGDEEVFYAVTKTCAKADDGNLYYDEFDTECSHGCDEETFECVKLVDEEGEDCDFETYEFRCDGNIRVGCGYDGKIVASPCDDNLTCAMIENMPSCLESCETVGEIVKECVQYNDSEENPTSAYLSTYVCTAFDDVNLLIEDDEAFVACESKICAEDMVSCEPVPEQLIACDQLGVTMTICTPGNDEVPASVTTFECVETDQGKFFQPLPSLYLCDTEFCNQDLNGCKEPDPEPDPEPVPDEE